MTFSVVLALLVARTSVVDGAIATAPSNMPSMYLRNDTRWLLKFEWEYTAGGQNVDVGMDGHDVSACDALPHYHCKQGQECSDAGKTIHHALCGTCFGKTAHFCSEDGTRIYRVTYTSDGCSQPLGECEECGKVNVQEDAPQEKAWVQQPKDAVCETIQGSCTTTCARNRRSMHNICYSSWQFSKQWFSVGEKESIPWPCQSGLDGTVI